MLRLQQGAAPGGTDKEKSSGGHSGQAGKASRAGGGGGGGGGIPCACQRSGSRRRRLRGSWPSSAGCQGNAGSREKGAGSEAPSPRAPSPHSSNIPSGPQKRVGRRGGGRGAAPTSSGASCDCTAAMGNHSSCGIWCASWGQAAALTALASACRARPSGLPGWSGRAMGHQGVVQGGAPPGGLSRLARRCPVGCAGAPASGARRRGSG